MGQITVFSGPERRRRWSENERLEILAEAFSPGACVVQVGVPVTYPAKVAVARMAEISHFLRIDFAK